MPVFALANAGVVFSGGITQHLSEPVTLGVALGLLLGKPIGIGLASWIAVKAGMALLPSGVNWNHIHGAAWLGGIGFTMSLFIAALAFPNPGLLATAKFGILAGSLLAGYYRLRDSAPWRARRCQFRGEWLKRTRRQRVAITECVMSRAVRRRARRWRRR